MRTVHKVTLDAFLGTTEQPSRPDDYDSSVHPYARFGWTTCAYLKATVPQRVITESLARGDAQGARTALRMLGALGTEQHPVWDVLAAAGEDGAP